MGSDADRRLLPLQVQEQASTTLTTLRCFTPPVDFSSPRETPFTRLLPRQAVPHGNWTSKALLGRAIRRARSLIYLFSSSKDLRHPRLSRSTGKEMAPCTRESARPHVAPPLPTSTRSSLLRYCYDYMRVRSNRFQQVFLTATERSLGLQKRGWTETASAFAMDAGINEDEWKGPPIEAPQGLLYECVVAGRSSCAIREGQLTPFADGGQSSGTSSSRGRKRPATGM